MKNVWPVHNGGTLRFAALSGAPHYSIFAPAFVRAHARPDACVAKGPCTDRARARTNKALQHRPATAKDATQFQCTPVSSRAQHPSTHARQLMTKRHTCAQRRAQPAPPDPSTRN
eukprot:2687982-Prymnesium_polylepis.1